MKSIIVKLSFIFLLFSNYLQANSSLYWINKLRDTAGMTKLSHNNTLEKSAKNHTNYLSINAKIHELNNISLHQERQGLPFYSGKNVGDRTIAVNYNHNIVLENISIGAETNKKAIENLMSAIYHRFAFLDFEINELGAGHNNKNYVFVLGRSDINHSCQFLPEIAQYKKPINCAGTIVSEKFFQGLCPKLPKSALYQKPWAESCPNRRLLNADYMKKLCQNLPQEAQKKKFGRYYQICNNQYGVNAYWFDNFCNKPPKEALYKSDDTFYRHCGQNIQANWLKNTCANAPQNEKLKSKEYFTKPCAKNYAIRVSYLDELTHKQRSANPEVVVWPVDGANNIPPAFFEETPDPLPNYNVSGYPISLQINPKWMGRVALDSFELYEVNHKKKRINDIKILDKKTDPNQNFTKYQFALMPLQRLKWGQTYEVKASWFLGNQYYSKVWQFSTKKLKGRFIDIIKEKGPYQVKQGETVVFYREPMPKNKEKLAPVKASYQNYSKIMMTFIDDNTMLLKITGKYCGSVKFSFADGLNREVICY